MNYCDRKIRPLQMSESNTFPKLILVLKKKISYLVNVYNSINISLALLKFMKVELIMDFSDF